MSEVSRNQLDQFLKVRGARQNNLKNIDIDIPLKKLTVVTGVSGSGKSSLAFDTIFAEGQRRYVQTFSPYARQFLDRMERSKLESIEGIPPAVAINQVNPIRTTRSTVGTMTELNDHLKLLFARAASLYCSNCGHRLKRHSSDEICDLIIDEFGSQKSERRNLVQILFSIKVPKNLTDEFVADHLQRQGYKRIVHRSKDLKFVVQDRTKAEVDNRPRLIEAIETSLEKGANQVFVQYLNEDRVGFGVVREYTSLLRCSSCKIDYSDPVPNLFSFNSPIGACETCRGFGQTLGIDYEQVVPDGTVSLKDGAVKLFNTKRFHEAYLDLIRNGQLNDIPLDLPWKELTVEQKTWVLKGQGQWYGVQGVFDYLERKKHKMHVRVLLSRYRAYLKCPKCRGSRLKSSAMNWRIGNQRDKVLNYRKIRLPSYTMSELQFDRLVGYSIHDLMSMQVDQCSNFFANLKLNTQFDEATSLLLDEIRSRLDYLVKVGLGYLNLDRKSRSLSGGEVQRINLTTALGTTLTNTLFVLDEPTIGLHFRDVARVIEILHKLRDTGNTLIVVEHDEQIIRNSDQVLELGPEGGEGGGEIVHYGNVDQLLNSNQSVTAHCIRDRTEKTIQKYRANPSTNSSQRGTNSTAPKQCLRVKNANENNLKNFDVSIPLNQFVCITGVSGSGKSTLVEEVLFRGIQKLKSHVVDKLGENGTIDGIELINDVVIVTQAAIGKTTRSNPATYMNVLSPIRDLLARQPLAVERKYSPGHFSFNVQVGRCPSCRGNGFEHIEMQFLSDVYLRCPDCNGTRFKSEIHDIKIPPAQNSSFDRSRSIVDIFELTAAEAIEFFGNHRTIVNRLTPLINVGLEYLKLGQPIPTLSGGEAQRLKLAAHIAKCRSRVNSSKTLYLFDEPTTGLHLKDVSKLIQSLRQLIDVGNSVVVIEHNLDLIGNSDWIIDLGPEGGEAGGEVVAEGTAETLAYQNSTYTAKALKAYFDASFVSEKHISWEFPKVACNNISLRNAREHNLKNISLSIPYNSITVITGKSGSGKSTVAFNILFAEGRKRYLETVNAYARQFVQPAMRADFDSVTGLPPTVAIEQRTSRGGNRSTVATLTEIYHYIRLLFVRFGVQFCPNCDLEINSQSVDSVVAQIQQNFKNKKIVVLTPIVVARKGYHTKIAQQAQSKGIDYLLVDGEFLSTKQWPRLSRYHEHDIDLPLATIDIDSSSSIELYEAIEKAGVTYNGQVRVALYSEIENGNITNLASYSTTRSCPRCDRSFAELDPRMFSYNSKHGWCNSCLGTGLAGGREYVDEKELDEIPESFNECGTCQGKRLKPESLAVQFKSYTIDEFTKLPIDRARARFEDLKLTNREFTAIGDILEEIVYRLKFLESVGLTYLSLDRSAPTLSGGEAQRIRFAAQLGSGLCGACYVLDEPTIGLHRRDNQRLLSALTALRDNGNTVVIVEHDDETIKSADYIVDLGPGGGTQGGQVVASGTVSQILNNPKSITGKSLRKTSQHPLPRQRPVPTNKNVIQIIGAELHNLKEIDVTIPVQSLVCVSGVSGSGKSTLVRDILYKNLSKLVSVSPKRKNRIDWENCREITGWKHFRRILQVDQTPIGKTPRSCPATYVKVWHIIRNLFAQSAEARLRGYSASRFSFNVESGRCSDCKGQGEKKIEMNFLPNVQVRCESCNGARFNSETLSVRYRDKTISDVLKMSMDEAERFFAANFSLRRIFNLLVDVGLGHLTLGQPSPTLSGGEAQRIKLVSELSKALPSRLSKNTKPDGKGAKNLYLLDEPTVGLHNADVEQLMGVIHALVDAGNTIVIVEHNLDVIAEADWNIDIGPEGGDQGGQVLFQGLQQDFLEFQNSHTATALREQLGKN